MNPIFAKENFPPPPPSPPLKQRGSPRQIMNLKKKTFFKVEKSFDSPAEEAPPQMSRPQGKRTSPISSLFN